MIPLVPIIFFFIILISTGHSDDFSLKKSLTFYASFDNGTNAEIAKGDKQLYTLINKKSKLGNHTDGMTRLVKGAGLSGDALMFSKRNAKWLFYDGNKNFHFAEKIGVAVSLFG